MSKLIKKIFNRVTIVTLLLLIQVFYLITIIWNLGTLYTYTYAIFTVAGVILSIIIVNDNKNPSYKIAWIIPILVFPLFGVVMYVFFGMSKSGKRLEKRMKPYDAECCKNLVQKKEIMDVFADSEKAAQKQANYIYDYAGYPVYENTYVEYFESGEKKFAALVEELKKAKRFIFLEYFIIQEGKMWNTVLEILEEKVKQGVDVRMIYDDIGCLFTLPFGYDLKLQKLGIKCKVFNPFSALLSIKMNNRDHRKILVIDGHTAFNGGINLADEYINEYEKHGHWKDSAVMLKGEAVWSFTMMFLSMWNYMNSVTDDDFNVYKPLPEEIAPFADSKGFVIPYTDSPLDEEPVGEIVYMNIINDAKDYVYITTPYLIADNEMITSLTLAAKGGIDVRIITPHIPDKWFVHAVTRAYYKKLIKVGVKIYEYTPGFIHAKNFVSDDIVGVVGTINLDFRSLYLHFECATWQYKTDSIKDIKEDYLKTLEVCHEVTYEECKNVNVFVRMQRALLRLFAPLM